MLVNANTALEQGVSCSHSLAISPDLDALVEHEERIGGSQQTAMEDSQRPLSPDVAVSREDLRGGLPPPPRGNRRARSPRTHRNKKTSLGDPTAIRQELREKTEPEGSTGVRNPYINRAPSVGHEKKEEGDEGGRPSEIERSPLKAVSLLDDNPSNSNGYQNIGLLFPASLSYNKNLIFRQPRRSPSLRKTTNMAAQSYRAFKSYDLAQDSPVLDIRRNSEDFIDITNGGAYRPLHDSRALSRRPSLDSNSSADTVRPPTPPAPDPVRSSFIDFYSPVTPRFPTLPPLDFGSPNSKLSFDKAHSPPPSSKSASKAMFPLPTSFKTKLISRGTSPHRGSAHAESLRPPTTNFLDMGEREDLVRKSRKLTQVFGETPEGEILSRNDLLLSSGSHLHRSKQSSRTAAALINDHPPYAAVRRYSMPLSPDELSLTFSETRVHRHIIRDRAPEVVKEYPESSVDRDNDKQASRVSFIDLSDDEEIDSEAAVSPINFAPNPDPVRSQQQERPPSPSQLSLYEAMTPEQQSEEEKRRNRERLAKLHRFLGSRVPVDLVLGVGHLDSPLPPIQPVMPAEDYSDFNKQWLRRRRSSSAGALPSWSDDVDRMKEELNNKEKAINVRRAHKMEKLFGVAPPQTLYHTRHTPSPSVPPDVYTKMSRPPPNPSFGGFLAPGEIPSPTFQQRNPNRSSYKKQRPKWVERPSMTDSTCRLLPDGSHEHQTLSDYQPSPIDARNSLVFHHYQHSLKSLGDILDRDDKESLAELHQYLNDLNEYDLSSDPTGSPLLETPLANERRLSNASSIKSERRRSLPTRTSVISLASEYSLATPKPDASDFQIRRRRAAKLTQFFGVNYRELIIDVLESLETGLEHERKRGTLRADEVEDLLRRLRKIKTHRKGFF